MNEKNIALKAEVVSKIGAVMDASQSFVVVEYRGLSVAKLTERGFNSPSYYEGLWSDAIVNVVNNMDSDQTIDTNRALVIFYSSVEFPVSE